MDDRDRLEGRIRDLAERSRRGDYLTRTGFLSLEEQTVALRALREMGYDPARTGTGCLLSGGYPEAERRVLVFLPSWMDGDSFEEESVITCLRAAPRSAKFTDHPGHRDYLGALMHLGITREVIGDILPGEDGAYLFVLSDMAQTIAGDLTQVRHTFVTTEPVPAAACTAAQKREPVRGSIASERIDAVIGMVFHLSRSAAKEYIDRELVYAGGNLVRSASYTPLPGERISVRGKGKFLYLGTEGSTKKGRLIATVEKFG